MTHSSSQKILIANTPNTNRKCWYTSLDKQKLKIKFLSTESNVYIIFELPSKYKWCQTCIYRSTVKLSVLYMWIVKWHKNGDKTAIEWMNVKTESCKKMNKITECEMASSRYNATTHDDHSWLIFVFSLRLQWEKYRKKYRKKYPRDAVLFEYCFSVHFFVLVTFSLYSVFLNMYNTHLYISCIFYV